MASDQGSTQSTLGEFLRQERESRGITIEQVASETKISVRLLHLLESDQYIELPAKPFIRGFVSSYCRFIGLDHKEVLIRFGGFLEEHSQERPTRDEGHSGYAFEKREGEQSRTILSVVMIAFVVIAGLAFVILKPSLHHHKNSHADKLRAANEPEVSSSASPSPSVSLSLEPSHSPSPTVSLALEKPVLVLPSPSKSPVPVFTSVMVTAPKIESKPSPSPTPSRSAVVKAPTPPMPVVSSPSGVPSPAPSDAKPDVLNSGVGLKGSEIKYKVVFKTSADIWVRYKVDERPMMKFILRAGRVLVLRGQQAVRFQTSSPDAITFRINSGPERSMVGDKNAIQAASGLTLVFSSEATDNSGDFASGEKPLEGLFVPAPKGSAPSPEPSP